MRRWALGLALLPLLWALQEHHFDHDVDVRHPESGEHVKLRSKGRLSETIDLDRVTGIKVKAFFFPCKAIILGVEGYTFFSIF